MQKNISLKLLPAEAADESAIKRLLASATAQNAIDITGFYPINRSIDARGKQVWININFRTFIQEPFHPRQLRAFEFKEVHDAPNRSLHQPTPLNCDRYFRTAPARRRDTSIRPVRV